MIFLIKNKIFLIIIILIIEYFFNVYYYKKILLVCFMKKILFIAILSVIVIFSQEECKGPDGDSKPTPFRHDKKFIKYSYNVTTEDFIFCSAIFFSIVVPSFVLINKK